MIEPRCNAIEVDRHHCSSCSVRYVQIYSDAKKDNRKAYWQWTMGEQYQMTKYTTFVALDGKEVYICVGSAAMHWLYSFAA